LFLTFILPICLSFISLFYAGMSEAYLCYT
jgi:hypothetical protein